MKRRVMEVHTKVTRWYVTEYYDIDDEENPSKPLMEDFCRNEFMNERPIDTEVDIHEVNYYD